MKWDIRIAFDVYRGRKRVFSLSWILPFLRRLRKRNRGYGRSCYAKTRYPTEQAAKNAEWFKKRPEQLFGVYACEMCDGWHITRD